MTKRLFYGLLLCAVLAANTSASGSDDDAARRNAVRERQIFMLIKEKLDTDAGNTNLCETDDLAYDDVGPLKGDTLKGSAASRVIFQKDVASGGKTGAKSTTYRYRLLYLPETEAFPLQVMRVTEYITQKSTSRITFEGSEGKAAERDTTAIEETQHTLDLEDLLALEESEAGTAGGRYGELHRLLTSLERRGRTHPLRRVGTGTLPNRPDHLSAESNRDYILSARVNDRHPFADLGRAERPVSVEVTLSTIAVSHKRLYVGSESIGIHGFGFEAGFGDRVLNHIAFQSPALSWGLRFLVFFNDARGSLIDSSFFLDMKILGRTPVNTASFIDRLRLRAASPLMSLDQPRLNVTPGATFEIGAGSPYNRFPFFTFMYSGGAKEYADPNVRCVTRDSSFAYFSTMQWEASLSYFWNVDRSMYNRFRFDVGAGTYDVRLVGYRPDGTVSSDAKVRGMSQVQPLLQLQYTHESSRARFGARVRFFDNRLTFTPWFKVFETGPHEVRLEAILMPRSVGRSLRSWEVDHGNLLQIRYRFGFDKNS